MKKKLFAIKLMHTIIWSVYVVIIFYILYSGIFNNINVLTYVAVGLVVLEGVILLIFKWRCPLTIVGLKYSDTDEVGFDIFIPKWLAKNNKTIFTTIFIIGLITVVLRMLVL